MRRALYLLLCWCCSISAAPIYWDWEIPVPTSAANVDSSKSEVFYSTQKIFDYEASSLDSIYDFYNKYFQEIGWFNPYADRDYSDSPFDYRGKWSSYRIAFNSDGQPEAYYSAPWEKEGIDVTASVLVKATAWEKDKFSAIVNVGFVPNVDSSPMFELQRLMTGSPKKVFALYKELGFPPLDIEKAVENRANIKSTSPEVLAYYEIIDKVLNGYREFATENGLVD